MVLRQAVVTLAALVLSMGILSGSGAATRDPWIVFVGSPDGATKPFQLFRMRLSGSGLGPVTHGRRNADDPAFSPDGGKLVFTRVGEGIFAVKPDGTKLRRLTHGAADRYPVWSPDGTTIAFLRAFRSELTLYVMRADGTKQHRLYLTPRPASRPSWTPNGRSLLVQAGGRFLQVDARTGKVERRLGLSVELAPTRLCLPSHPTGAALFTVGADPNPHDASEPRVNCSRST